MGSILLDAGDAAEALATCRRSREICRDIGNHRAERAALDTMARIHRFRGDLERASLNFEAALAIGRGDGDDAADATTMVELAAVRLLLGDAAHAAELADEALVLARARVAAVLPSIAPVAAEVIATNGAPDEARHLLLALGRIDGRAGEPREAARRFEDALASARSVGRLDLEARILEARTDVHKVLGDAQSAILDLERRLQLVESSSAERLATRVEMLRLVHDENESRSRADVLDRLIG
jgi:tetratricopeptide (TPR) repeat protein